MAPSFACVFALLVSQVTVVSAAESPFNDAASRTNTIACLGYDASCTCAGVGKVDNASQSTMNCSSTGGRRRAPNFDTCSSPCCGEPAVATCGSLFMSNNNLCGTAMDVDYPSATKAAGATAAEHLLNCCRAKVTATCSQVTCASRRRSSDAVVYQPKGLGTSSRVAGTIACTSDDDCETKCCEKNSLMCGGVSGMDHYTWCGVNHTVKALETSGPAPACDTTPTAATTATFTMTTDNATFKAACCDPKPATPTCGATPTCPAHFEARPSNANWKCRAATCTSSECCQLMIGHTQDQCSSNCTAGTDGYFDTQNGCSWSRTEYCSSTRCAAGLKLDKSFSKVIFNLVNATDAMFSTACCIASQAATVDVPAKCSAYFVAAAAGEAKAKGTAGSAYMQGASLPILAVAMLMLMKF